ncbi:MAG TPA: bifunctional UDP-N-acetylglucosamine diphosphorylase/glucosamine-1-phosphate N-acetyltransferase GlmU [Vicinamibacterales bacterium]|nr:bifunctional UDP-N-acetylglucosamine diphosphorylase/glucosamine-1-phosphate N-acetyltransferase GlmU [Vicinamibacterales bacterium]
MEDLHLVILAAGKGTRMKSAAPKVLHRVAGLPMVEHVLRAAAPLHARTTVVVVGYEADRVRQALAGWPGLRFALQEPQLGTGHAVLQAAPALAGARGTLLVLSGDVPLLRPATLAALVARHREQGAAMTVLTALVERPDGYGRIVRDEAGTLLRIVEERDASPAERAIREINTGIYAFALEPLFDALHAVGDRNAQGEYYLPDLAAIYRERGLRVEALVADDWQEVIGVNTRQELAEAAAALRRRRAEALMAAGVTLEDPSATYVGPDVEVGPDTILHPNVHLEGRTRIGSGCEIHAGARIVDSTLGDRVVVQNCCLITDSVIEDDASIGPFAHLRPASHVGRRARVGNFVELKKTTLGAGSKAPHLSYLGDAVIGERVNVGAGTITCNYDGERKYQTIIEDEAFIGSDTQLIAPVRIGRGAYVAAGSSITEDVPPGALAIGRGRQVNKEGWAARRKKEVGR